MSIKINGQDYEISTSVQDQCDVVDGNEPICPFCAKQLVINDDPFVPFLWIKAGKSIPEGEMALCTTCKKIFTVMYRLPDGSWWD